jgi:hypothetical protein
MDRKTSRELFLRTSVAWALIVLFAPLVVFIVGAWSQAKWSGQDKIASRLAEEALPKDAKPLYLRLKGYDVEAVNGRWSKLRELLSNERRFLELDLVFPILYGTAFFLSALAARKILDGRLPGLWSSPMISIAITVIADWTENVIQLGQLKRFTDPAKPGLQAMQIAVASTATTIKLVSFALTIVLLIALALAVGGVWFKQPAN